MTFRVRRNGVWVTPESTGVVVEPWERPADWLPLPPVTAGEQKVVGLYAIEDHPSNFVAIQIAGAFTVDWGDGSAPENFAANAIANHTFSFAALPAETTTSRGFRQAIITITMQAGQNLTWFNLGNKPSGSSTGTFAHSAWLDVEGSGSSLASLQVTGANTSTSSRPRWMERFVWRGTNVLTSLNSMFGGCVSLQEFDMDTTTSTAFSSTFADCAMLRTIPLLNTAAGTTFASMFFGCRSLVKVPLIDTANGASFNSMFSGCSSLKEVADLNLAKCTDLISMFNGCASLEEAPTLSLNIGAAASFNMNSTFLGCSSLREAPVLDTRNATTFTNTFSNCFSMKTAPAYDYAKAGSTAGMFSQCYSLETVGAPFNTTMLTTVSAMFVNCYALEEAPLFDTVNVTVFNSMFQDARALRVVPLYDTAKALGVQNMFNGCNALRNIPALDVAAVNSAANFTSFVNNSSLAKIDIRGARFGFNLQNQGLTAAELDRVYTNLGTASGANTITVTNNPGTTGDTPSIATAKGWTVTGS